MISLPKKLKSKVTKNHVCVNLTEKIGTTIVKEISDELNHMDERKLI